MPALNGTSCVEREPLASIPVEDSLEALFTTHDMASRSVYLATIALVLVSLAAVTVTSIDLSVRAPATLVPAIDRPTVRSLSDGAVERMHVSIGQSVNSGDTLVALTTATIEQAVSAAQSALTAQERQNADLHSLVRARFDQPVPASQLLPRNAAVAQAAYIEWTQGTVQVARAQRVRDRAAVLMQRGFAAPTEVEAAEFDLARAREDGSLTLERRRAAWAEGIADGQQRVTDLRRELTALRGTETARYVLALECGRACSSKATTCRSGVPSMPRSWMWRVTIRWRMGIPCSACASGPCGWSCDARTPAHSDCAAAPVRRYGQGRNVTARTVARRAAGWFDGLIAFASTREGIVSASALLWVIAGLVGWASFRVIARGSVSYRGEPAEA